MPRETVLIGYLPKRIVDLSGDVDAPRLPVVAEICSVSECISKAPPEWGRCGLHNTDTWLFDGPGAAWWVVPEAERERYRLYAYRLLPALFHESGKKTGHPLPELNVAPIPLHFTRIGYDAVQRCVGDIHEGGVVTPAFFCSPLSCNLMAEEHPVNRYCLANDLDSAVTMAKTSPPAIVSPGRTAWSKSGRVRRGDAGFHWPGSQRAAHRRIPGLHTARNEKQLQDVVQRDGGSHGNWPSRPLRMSTRNASRRPTCDQTCSNADGS